MDRMKQYWKHIAAGLGISAVSLFTYLMFKKFSSKRLKAGLSKLSPYDISAFPLKKSEAFERSNLLKNIHYTLFLQLTADTDLATRNHFDGSALIQFDIEGKNKIPSSGLFIDFAGNIKKLQINGEEVPVKSIDHRGHRLYLNNELLVESGNRVEVFYVNHYSNDSHGMRNYIDPDDENPYVYTSFEPFYAHTAFPCFDQPNLKATFKLYLATQSNWTAISSSKLTKTLSDSKEIQNKLTEIHSGTFGTPSIRSSYSLHEFEQISSPIAPFAFSIFAGNFVEIEDFAYDKSENLPEMKIYCRSFLERTCDSFPIFKTAKESMKWFRENLQCDSTTHTLNIVLVPNLKKAAIESVGCLVIEDTILEQTLTPLDQALHHSFLTRSIALNYFGNYVTPTFWDDLWLYQSLAIFLSFLSLQQISEKLPEEMGHLPFNEMWAIFSKYKTKAVVFDQYRSTHPVIRSVEDTTESLIKNDEVSFYKGISILKYFYYVIGEEVFFKILKTFVAKYHGKNANYEQFKEVMKSTESTDLINAGLNNLNTENSKIAQIQQFLENSGIIKLEYSVKYTDNLIDEFTITQKPAHFATAEKYYNFRFNILLIYPDKEILINDIEITSQTSILTQLKKFEKPQAIILNAGDWAYFKQIFDESSLNYLLENSYKIKNPVNRLLVVRDMFEMIREGTIDAEQFVNFTVNLLKHEIDAAVVNKALHFAIYAVNNFLIFEKSEKIKEQIFTLIREDLFNKFNDLKINLINYMIDLINFSNDKEIRFLINFLKKEKSANNNNLLRGESEILDNVDLIRSFDLSYIDSKTKLRLLETIEESDVLSKEEKDQFENLILRIEASNTSRIISPNNSQIDMSKSRIGNKNDLLYSTGNRLERLTLEACKPDRLLKEKLWAMFVYRDAELLDQEYEAYMKGFARKSQFKLLKKYFKYQFFEDFLYVKDRHGEKYAAMFFEHLNPGWLVSEKVLDGFMKMRFRIRADEKKLLSLLDKTIAQLQINLRVIKRNKYVQHKKEETKN